MMRAQGVSPGVCREMGVRDRAFVLVIAGLIVIKLACLQLLASGASGPAIMPVVAAFLGLAVATLGFCSFSGYAKRTRLARSVRTPGFRYRQDERRASGSAAHPLSLSARPSASAELIARRRWQYPDLN